MMCPNLCDVLIALLIHEPPGFERTIRDASRIQPFAKRVEGVAEPPLAPVAGQQGGSFRDGRGAHEGSKHRTTRKAPFRAFRVAHREEMQRSNVDRLRPSFYDVAE